MPTKTFKGPSGAWLCALGLVIGLTGCQTHVTKAPPPAAPPPLRAAPLPRPVRPSFYVTINHLNLRSCPGLDCPKTSTLPLNTEVEKLGEVKNWTQVKIKKDGTVGYVSSRYLAPQPVKVAQHLRKKSRKAKLQKAAPPAATAKKEGEAGSKTQEAAAALPRVM
jgi:uncharacterized protein YgiM (DUF1202 family)